MSTPTLHDERIDKMRMSVMHRIDHDVTRRGRRARTALGLAAAGVLVVGLGGYAVGQLDRSGDDVAASSSAGASAAEEPSSRPASPERLTSDGGGQAEKAPTDQGAVALDAREVITTGSADVTVARPRAAAQRLSTWIESIGGRVDERSESGSGDEARASVTVRVPSSKVTATIEQWRADGAVDDVSVQNSDVTTLSRDLDARISALRLSIDRLSSILAGTSSSNEVVRAENALTERQTQLESLQAQRAAIADQVSLSTLTIGLVQEPTASSVEPGGFTGGLRDCWNGLVGTLNRIVEVTGVLLPWAAVAAAALLLWRLVTRRRPRT